MPPLAYDPSRVALLSPGRRETLFESGTVYSPLQLAIEAARLAYIHAEKSATERTRLADALARAGFGEPRLFLDPPTGTEAYGAVRPDDRLALLGFRGTEPDRLSDLATDLKAHPVTWSESAGRVHAGFAHAARAVLPQVRDWLAGDAAGRDALLLTGHSLGAALATLAASVLKPAFLFTIGSPRVGDATFAATVAAIDGARIVDCCDAITRVPPSLTVYTHIRAETYITRDGVALHGPDPETIAADRRRARAEYLRTHALQPGAVLVRDLADHAPINYARAFF